MSWFWTAIVLCFAFSNPSGAEHQKKLPSAVVVGTVYCDTCFHKASHFIAGATVAVECRDATSRPHFLQKVETDERGDFKVHLPFSVSKHVKKIKGCSVKLLSSNEPYCAVAAAATSSNLHLKSRTEGTHIFSAGFFTFKPLKQPEVCDQRPTINNANKLTTAENKLSATSYPNGPTFLPPFQDPPSPPSIGRFLPPLPELPKLPPLPELPRLPPLPSIPYLPPMRGKETLPDLSRKLTTKKRSGTSTVPQKEAAASISQEPISTRIFGRSTASKKEAVTILPQKLTSMKRFRTSTAPKKETRVDLPKKLTSTRKFGTMMETKKETDVDLLKELTLKRGIGTSMSTSSQLTEAAQLLDKMEDQPASFLLPPNPFNPPSIFPPNPFQPPPSLLPPNPFQPPPSVLPPIFPSPPPSIFPPLFPLPPPSPVFGLPPIPGLTPSPPPPPPISFPIPLPPFPFQPTPGFPGVPPAMVSSP